MKKQNIGFAIRSFALPLLLLSACTTEPAKTSTQWTVKATTEGQRKIWVTKPDGSQQCAPKSSVLSPALAAQQLKVSGVPVFEFKTGSDGKMHIQKCGAPTGRTVDLEISRNDISRALSLGYVTKSTAEE